MSNWELGVLLLSDEKGAPLRVTGPKRHARLNLPPPLDAPRRLRAYAQDDQPLPNSLADVESAVARMTQAGSGKLAWQCELIAPEGKRATSRTGAAEQQPASLTITPAALLQYRGAVKVGDELRVEVHDEKEVVWILANETRPPPEIKEQKLPPQSQQSRQQASTTAAGGSQDARLSTPVVAGASAWRKTGTSFAAAKPASARAGAAGAPASSGSAGPATGRHTGAAGDQPKSANSAGKSKPAAGQAWRRRT